MLAVKSGVDLQRSLRPAQQQRRVDQQHETRGDLRNNEYVSQARLAQPFPKHAAAIFKRRIYVGP